MKEPLLAELNLLKKAIEQFIAEKDNLGESEAQNKATELLTNLNNLLGGLEEKVALITESPRGHLEQELQKTINKIRELEKKLASYSTTPQEIALFLKGPLPETEAEKEMTEGLKEEDKVQKALIRHKGDDKRVPVDRSVKLEELKECDKVYVLGDKSICLMGKAPDTMLSKVKIGYVVEIFEKTNTVAVSTGEQQEEKVVCRLANWIKKNELELLSRALVDTTNEVVIELLPPDQEMQKQFEVHNLADITFDDIGGLNKEIEKIKTLFTDVFIYSDLYKIAKIALVKSLLLYGPSGCGKTMIAKALTNELIKTIQRECAQKVVGYYRNFDAASFLQKYVGVGEAMIEKMFVEAAKFQKEGEKIGERRFFLNIIDEMDAAFKARGAGISTDANESLVLKLCAKLDGLEQFRDIIIIGTTNRADRLDGALARRFIKIEIPFPNEAGVKDIFRKHLRGLIIKENVPINEKYLVEKYPLHHRDSVTKKDIPNLDSNGQPMFVEFNREPEKIIEEYFIKQIIQHIKDPHPKTLPNETTRPPFPLKGKLSGSDIENILFNARIIMLQEAKDKIKKGEVDFKMTLCLGHIHDAIDEFAELVKSAERDSRENFFNPIRGNER